MENKTPVPSSKQELLEYFQSLSYEELTAVYKMAHSNDSEFELVDNLADYEESNQSVEIVGSAKKLKASGRKSKLKMERNIKSVDITRIYPFCNSQTIYKYGIRKGLQRYRCTSCATVFTPNTNTVMSYSHKPSKV